MIPNTSRGFSKRTLDYIVFEIDSISCSLVEAKSYQFSRSSSFLDSTLIASLRYLSEVNPGLVWLSQNGTFLQTKQLMQ